MNQKLQQAILAARAGQNKEAQLLLTQVLKDDPNEVQAWFLLSHVVDSEQKQIAYLKKVMALDPAHEKANERLAQLEPPHSLPVVEGTMDLDADESLDGVLSDWVPEEVEETDLEADVSLPEPPGVTEELTAATPDAGPDAEPEAAAEGMLQPVEKVEASTATAATPFEPVTDEVDHQRQTLFLTIGLIGLVAAATIVFIALLYAIFSAL